VVPLFLLFLHSKVAVVEGKREKKKKKKKKKDKKPQAWLKLQFFGSTLLQEKKMKPYLKLIHPFVSTPTR
jgi:hypothetical protein